MKKQFVFSAQNINNLNDYIKNMNYEDYENYFAKIDAELYIA